MLNYPLIEVSCELRVIPTPGSSIELLMKMMNRFQFEYLNVIQKDGLNIPKEIKEQNHKLCYIPSYEIVYSDFSIFISDGSVAIIEKNLNELKYRGWEKFKQIPIQVIETLFEKQTIQRISLKYSNLINNELDKISVQIGIGDKLSFSESESIDFKSQRKDNDVYNIIEISHPVNIQLFDKNESIHRSGTLIAIDSIYEVNEITPISNMKQHLEDVHRAAIAVFSSIYKGD